MRYQEITDDDWEEDEPVHYDGWRWPTEDELRLEFSIKMKKPTYCQNFRNQGANIFDNWENFYTAVKSAKEVRLTFAHDMRIIRRSHCHSLEQLQSITDQYRYPRDIPRLVDGYRNGDSIPMPLIMQLGGSEIIIAGNTRLDVARIMEMSPDPIVLLIPGKI